MADNDWINGYLEAILDTEGSAVAKQAPQKGKKDKKSEGKEAATKEDSLAVPFFVKQITGFDETDLHRTWMKVCMHDTMTICQSAVIANATLRCQHLKPDWFL